MKIEALGKPLLQGSGKKTGSPCCFILVRYPGCASGIVGEAALAQNPDSGSWLYGKITVPGEYAVEFKGRGFAVGANCGPDLCGIMRRSMPGTWSRGTICPPIGARTERLAPLSASAAIQAPFWYASSLRSESAITWAYFLKHSEIIIDSNAAHFRQRPAKSRRILRFACFYLK